MCKYILKETYDNNNITTNQCSTKIPRFLKSFNKVPKSLQQFFWLRKSVGLNCSILLGNLKRDF